MKCWRWDEAPARSQRNRVNQALCKHYGYGRVNQEGSHVVLETSSPRKHRTSIPDHAQLRIGTLNAILKVVAKAQGVEKESILQRL